MRIVRVQRARVRMSEGEGRVCATQSRRARSAGGRAERVHAGSQGDCTSAVRGLPESPGASERERVKRRRERGEEPLGERASSGRSGLDGLEAHTGFV